MAVTKQSEKKVLKKTPLVLFIFCVFFVHVVCTHQATNKVDSGNGKSNPDKINIMMKYNSSKIQEHIDRIHNIKKITLTQKAIKNLLTIYQHDIKPLETAYRYKDLNKDAVLDALILAKPLLILLGPWSTGKTTFINYILNIEDSAQKLYTGPQPTTSDFTIIQHGPEYKISKGLELVSEQNTVFSSLDSYGQPFLERLQGVELPLPLLQQITIVDTPGILENKKQQNRGYPFNEIINWFLQRASTVFLMFDPTKMEVGSELEAVLNTIKGHEGKVKLVLNKADTLSQQELMKVYGALFWNLAPIIKSVEPPRVYVVSLRSKVNSDHPLRLLFQEDEIALLTHLQQSIENQVQNKVGYFRKHASMVRCHALTVDHFLKVFNQHKSLIFNNQALWTNIYENPDMYQVFQNLLFKYTYITKHDLLESEPYRQFFQNNPKELFLEIDKHCSYLGTCAIDKINQAITVKLPGVLEGLKDISSNAYCHRETSNAYGHRETCN